MSCLCCLASLLKLKSRVNLVDNLFCVSFFSQRGLTTTGTFATSGNAQGTTAMWDPWKAGSAWNDTEVIMCACATVTVTTKMAATRLQRWRHRTTLDAFWLWWRVYWRQLPQRWCWQGTDSLSAFFIVSGHALHAQKYIMQKNVIWRHLNISPLFKVNSQT